MVCGSIGAACFTP
ncbi:hypothetical protein M2H09_22095 [Vibrio vulnificus]|nr:hypothetical protein [Vibrio parahaemolyticus]MCU8207993.1 hypothetical protein [Vibrio vulnificus]